MAIEQLSDSVVAFAPRGRAKMQEIIDSMNGSSGNFHEAMVAWLDTLPTADPEVAGEPYLAAGVLTVSTGPA